jgi:HlyD family secretion protein
VIKKKTKGVLYLKALTMLVLVGLVSFFMWQKPPPLSSGFLGYVEGEYVRVASPIAGSLVTLAMTRGMTVVPGQPLFTLERANEVAARNEAFQRYERAKYDLENIKVGKRPEEIEVIVGTLVQAEADQKFNTLYLERQNKLIESNSTSYESLDRARSKFNQGEARIAELKAQLRVAKLPGREMEIKALEKQKVAAKEVLAQAQWRLDQKSIKSPVTGLIFDTLYVPGEWVPAGSPIVVILPPENIKVRFFVPERMLGGFKIGQHLIIQVDGLDKDLSAKLTYISPTAEYTPPVIFSREWREKQLYMMEARPLVNPEALHPGQPVEVVIGGS